MTTTTTPDSSLWLDVGSEGTNNNTTTNTNITNSIPISTDNNNNNDQRRTMILLSMPKSKSGLFGASSNLVNSIVGAGIIGIPYALRQSGLVAGIFLLILVAFLTDKSLRIIVDLASLHPKLRHRGVMTFEDLASYPFGGIGYNFILLNMFILAYGAMIAYLLIIKDTVPTIFGVEPAGENPGSIRREIILIATSLIVMVPLSIQRDMASLAFTSLLSVAADVILVGFIAAYAPVRDTVSAEGGFANVLRKDWVNGTLFVGLGILSTAMACQHSAFIVSGSLENKTSKRWATVTGSSITVAAILCAILGIFGYLGFLDETMGDILNNFDAESAEANGARALLAVTMFFTYPMESFVARHVLIMILFKGDLDGAHHDNTNTTTTTTTGGLFCCNRRVKWTLAIYLMALIPALIVDDLGPVLSITGSLGGSCISYMAPGLVYLGVNGDVFLGMINRSIESYQLSKRNRQNNSIGGDVELPVAGDAQQTINSLSTQQHQQDQQQQHPTIGSSSTLQLPMAGEQRNLIVSDGSKPIWYYLGGFSIWCTIASYGQQNMRKRLDDDADSGNTTTNFQQYNTPTPTTGRRDDEDIMAQPTKGDFVMSIFFIMFGLLGAIAGIGSNIYVQWHKSAY